MAKRSAVALDELDGPRTLRPDELPASHRLSVRCFGHSTLVDLPAGPYRPTSRQSIEVISHRGVPVSQIAIYYSHLNVYGCSLRVASIGGVGTHPDYRGIGLATRLLGHCMRLVTGQRSRLLLVSGTRGLYLRGGCTLAQISEPVVLRPGCPLPREVGTSIRPATVADAPLCARLYQAESVHFERRVEEFQGHLQSAGPGPCGDNWIVESEGEPVAYVFLRIPWWPSPGSNVRETLVQGEYAGSRVALAGALSELVARLDLDELWMAVSWQDADLRQMLRRSGLREDLTTMFGHTMRIVDLPSLMDDLQGYVRARLSVEQIRALRFESDGDRHMIASGPDRLELDGIGVTRLVLGLPPSRKADVPAVPPALARTTSSLFPLPSFLPGLNCR